MQIRSARAHRRGEPARRGIEPRKAARLLGHKVTTHLAFYEPNSDEGAAEAARVAGGLFTVDQ